MISVVTITFNNYEELLKTVDSVEGLPIQHIIVNGGTCAKTAEFLRHFPGIHVSEPDRGISDAFNKGIRLSTGDGIMFLNSGDALANRDYLSWADHEIKKFDFLYSDIFFDDPLAGRLVLKPHGKPLGRGMPFPHQSMIVAKRVFDQVGEFKLDYKRAMCFEFTCRMLKAGFKGRYFPRPTIYMDGTGISAAQEDKTLEESKRAMVENQIYDAGNRFYFGVRSAGFLFRKMLLTLHLAPVLKHLKRLKRALD